MKKLGFSVAALFGVLALTVPNAALAYDRNDYRPASRYSYSNTQIFSGGDRDDYAYRNNQVDRYEYANRDSSERIVRGWQTPERGERVVRERSNGRSNGDNGGYRYNR